MKIIIDEKEIKKKINEYKDNPVLKTEPIKILGLVMWELITEKYENKYHGTKKLHAPAYCSECGKETNIFSFPMKFELCSDCLAKEEAIWLKDK